MSTILGGAIVDGDCGCDCSGGSGEPPCSEIPGTLTAVFSGFSSLGCGGGGGAGYPAGMRVTSLGSLNGALTLTAISYGIWNWNSNMEGASFGGTMDGYGDEGCSTGDTPYSNNTSEYVLICTDLNQLSFSLVTAYGAGDAFPLQVCLGGAITVTDAMIAAQSITIPLSGGAPYYSNGSMTISW